MSPWLEGVAWACLVILGCAPAALAALRPRAGATAVSAVLVVSALTAWVLPLGK